MPEILPLDVLEDWAQAQHKQAVGGMAENRRAGFEMLATWWEGYLSLATQLVTFLSMFGKDGVDGLGKD